MSTGALLSGSAHSTPKGGPRQVKNAAGARWTREFSAVSRKRFAGRVYALPSLVIAPAGHRGAGATVGLRARAAFDVDDLGASVELALPDGRGSDRDRRSRLYRSSNSSPRRFLDDADFIVGQGVERVNEFVDPAVGGVNLALKGRLVHWRGQVVRQI